MEELLARPTDDERLAKCFRVEKSESREVSVPFNLALAETGDVAAWASSYTGFLRAFTEAILASALPEHSDRAEILDQIYQRVEHLLAAEPTRHEFHYISVAALLTRL